MKQKLSLVDAETEDIESVRKYYTLNICLVEILYSKNEKLFIGY